MRKILSAVAISIIVAISPLGQAAKAADVITITGKVGITNRPEFDPFRDAFFKHHDRVFKKAFAFDLKALQNLPQHEVTARFEEWPRVIRGRGPRLRDVLRAAKVPKDAKLTIVALDGYGAELEPADLNAHDWIVAIAVDGEPLGIGGRGPSWLMYNTSSKTLSADAEAKWVWSAFLIVAE